MIEFKELDNCNRGKGLLLMAALLVCAGHLEFSKSTCKTHDAFKIVGEKNICYSVWVLFHRLNVTSNTKVADNYEFFVLANSMKVTVCQDNPENRRVKQLRSHRGFFCNYTVSVMSFKTYPWGPKQ